MAVIFQTYLNENMWNSIKISLKFIPTGPINNIWALFQMKAWHQPGDKPLSEPMMALFTDAYMRHLGSITCTELQIKIKITPLKYTKLTTKFLNEKSWFIYD